MPDELPSENGRSTKMAETDELKAEYTREELGEGVRGKYYERYREGANVALLEDDVAAVFPDSQAVNQALRSLMRVAERTVHAGKK